MIHKHIYIYILEIGLASRATISSMSRVGVLGVMEIREKQKFIKSDLQTNKTKNSRKLKIE